MLTSIIRSLTRFREERRLDRLVSLLGAGVLAAAAIAARDNIVEVSAAIVALAALYVTPLVLDIRRFVQETARHADRTNRLLMSQATPDIMVSFERSGPDAIVVLIEHVGLVPVRNIAISFDPSLRNSRSEAIRITSPSGRIPLMRPGDRIEVPFDSIRTFRSVLHLSGMRHEMREAPPPKPETSFEATVRYRMPHKGADETILRYDLDVAALLGDDGTG